MLVFLNHAKVVDDLILTESPPRLLALCKAWLSAARDDLKKLSVQYEAYIGLKLVTRDSGAVTVNGKLTQRGWQVRFYDTLARAVRKRKSLVEGK